jgi:hypothetical protein
VSGVSTYRRMKMLQKFNKTSIDLVCPRSARHDHLENLALILWGLCRILLHRYHLPYGRSCYRLLFPAILRLSARFVFWMQSYIRLHSWLHFAKHKYFGIFVICACFLALLLGERIKKLCSCSWKLACRITTCACTHALTHTHNHSRIHTHTHVWLSPHTGSSLNTNYN